jgi:SAM-dependent methyltransferase
VALEVRPADVRGSYGLQPSDFGAHPPRIRHDVELVTGLIGTTGKVCDLGSGLSLFASECARLGLDASVVDDFYDLEHSDPPGLLDLTLERLARDGVEVHRQDILGSPLPFGDSELDAICLFHVIEHLHASPRPLLHEMLRVLKPGGQLVIAAPNAANLRKRTSALVGRTEWSPWEAWYEAPRFRSHVREPRVQDFRRIALDLGLADWRIFGANFIGSSQDGLAGTLARILDRPLRLRPALCSDIYLVGRTPSEGHIDGL